MMVAIPEGLPLAVDLLPCAHRQGAKGGGKAKGKSEEDSIDGFYDGVYNTLKQCALISKSAGSIGVAISNAQAKGRLAWSTRREAWSSRRTASTVSTTL